MLKVAYLTNMALNRMQRSSPKRDGSTKRTESSISWIFKISFKIFWNFNIVNPKQLSIVKNGSIIKKKAMTLKVVGHKSGV